MTSAADELLLDIEGGVAIVTLNRPAQLNSATWGMVDAMAEAFRNFGERDDVKAVVLTGAGRAFCAGADLTQREPPHTPRHLRKVNRGNYSRVTIAMRDMDKPIVAAVRGAAVGAGFSYALACDRRFAEPSARFGAIWTARGMHPDAGLCHFLPRVVRMPDALRLVSTGEIIDVDEAYRMGIVDEICPDGGALAAAVEYAQRLARGACVAAELARRGVLLGRDRDLETMLHYEGFAASACAGTEDRKEGVRAFLEKRAPAFSGR